MVMYQKLFLLIFIAVVTSVLDTSLYEENRQFSPNTRSILRF